MDDVDLPVLDNGPVIDRSSPVPAAIGGALLGLIIAGALPLLTPGWAPLSLALVFPVAALLGGSLAVLLHRQSRRPSSASALEHALTQTLLRRLGGDSARLERLIELERKSVPLANHYELLQRTLERLERDRR